MKKIIATSLVAVVLASTSACAVNRALSKPAPKDLQVLKQGEERDTVRAELGSYTISADSPACDVHSFIEGSGDFKYLRAITYSLLDLASLGIMEIVTNPIEASIGDAKVRLRACYSDKNRLQSVDQLKKSGSVPLKLSHHPAQPATTKAV